MTEHLEIKECHDYGRRIWAPTIHQGTTQDGSGGASHFQINKPDRYIKIGTEKFMLLHIGRHLHRVGGFYQNGDI